jgi:hypothetical protein
MSRVTTRNSWKARAAARPLALAIAAALAALPPASAARSSPPQGGPPRPLKVPAIQDEVLPNGLAVRLVEDHRFPMVTAVLALPFGRAADPPEMPGLCAATADLLKEGTAKLTSRQIADDLASMGGGIDAAAEADVVRVTPPLSRSTPRV